MDNGFDSSALTYDQTFTYSSIGKYLRLHIHDYLDRSFRERGKLKILELNCGTGEDALYFAGKGHSVVATDSSSRMLEEAKKKAGQRSAGMPIRFERIDINELGHVPLEEPFDLVFSDFGGLNCISPSGLRELSGTVSNLLSRDGRFIAVVMSKYCLWEIGYFLLKGKAGKAFRRTQNESLDVNVEGTMIRTYYYTPAQMEKLFFPEFSRVGRAPVGLFLPPTYMERFFQKRAGLLSFLNRCESAAGKYAGLAAFGDHFLLDLRRVV